MSREPWIEIEIMSVAEFKVSELWPDGDAPETITKADVQALVDRESPRRLMDEWFFPTPDIDIRLIDPNKEHFNTDSIPGVAGLSDTRRREG